MRTAYRKAGSGHSPVQNMILNPSSSKTRIDRAGETVREWWASGLPEDQ